MIDEETAPVVRNIFKWASDLMGDMRIAQRLKEYGNLDSENYTSLKEEMSKGLPSDYWSVGPVRFKASLS